MEVFSWVADEVGAILAEQAGRVSARVVRGRRG